MEEIKFKKSLGQNFIFDKNLLNAIATDGEVGTGGVVFGVCAGAGSGSFLSDGSCGDGCLINPRKTYVIY